MQRNLNRLRSGQFDIVVVGGGITGAAIAHDAALRGLSVALVERRDFGGATSAGSSRVLHGGIRFLQRGDFAKARASARERARFHSIAPRLTAELPILIPTRGHGMQGRALLGAAAAAYSLLTTDEGRLTAGVGTALPAPTMLSRAELVAVAPALADDRRVTGALLLYERQMRSAERMTLAFVASAAANGAVVANYCAVDRVLRRGSTVGGVRAIDEIGGGDVEINARLVVNAAGPWSNGLNAAMGIGVRPQRPVWPSKGMHILTRPLAGRYGVALATDHQARTVVSRGGRHLFILPWRDHAQIGTTNSRYDGSPDDVRAEDADIDALLSDVNQLLPGLDLKRADVLHAFGGLFPVSRPTAAPDIYQGTGDHDIADHARACGISGLMSVVGSKYTFARRVAERAVDCAERKLGYRPRRCVTAEARLLVGPNPSGSCEARDTIAAAVQFAVKHEMAQHLDDVVRRRTSLGALGHPGSATLLACARMMAPELGWSQNDVAFEVERTAAQFPVAPRTAATLPLREAAEQVEITAGV